MKIKTTHTCTFLVTCSLFPTASYSDVLRCVEAPIVDQVTCNAPSSYTGIITDNMLCIGYPDGGKDACDVSCSATPVEHSTKMELKKKEKNLLSTKLMLANKTLLEK